MSKLKMGEELTTLIDQIYENFAIRVEQGVEVFPDMEQAVAEDHIVDIVLHLFIVESLITNTILNMLIGANNHDEVIHAVNVCRERLNEDPLFTDTDLREYVMVTLQKLSQTLLYIRGCLD